MTTLSMRYLRGDFVVTGPDIEPVRFKTRREAWVWCFQHHPGSPVKVVGADATKRAAKGKHRRRGEANDGISIRPCSI